MLGESLELSVSINPERKGKKRREDQECSITSWSNKGQRRKILSEEDYVSGLTDIVIRDFYPAIPSLRRDIAVLDCRSMGDVSGAVAVRRAAREKEQQHAVTTTTLAEFHQQMTSEDNAEFERIQAEELKAHQQETEQKYRCVKHGAKKPVDEESALASDLFTITLPKTTPDTSEKFQNDFFFYPENRNEPSRPQQQQHLLEGKNSQHDNNNLLMPPPPHRSTSDVNSELSSVHSINTKVIQYSQTRFPYQNSSRLPPANSSNTNIEIPSREISNAEDTDDTDLDATPISLTRARAERANMKANELNTFIPMTPLIAPARGTLVQQQPLPVFSLKEESSRERLVPIATSMVTKNKPKKQHIPPLLVSAAANLTPAAIQLLQKKTNNNSISLHNQQPVANARLGSALRSALRSSYTPVVTRLNRNPSSTSSRRGAAAATPRSQRSGDVHHKSTNNKKGNITDGLLLL